ncbi:MAG: peptidoglycan DD-metalloendopeptidase family protein [Comamonadaceae bacterium]|jgi:lipoprotein NlpD|uniref:peptidoglycan DD-metalloendopeptidase family protein n=1 Tax=Candidatus Skiveiella danica TaxID=3386177 RepID=UPI00390C1AC4|nr:peptidoglycan DD-metalloendopeptidase family protein [Comamonadaceae bacterium]MBK7119426.1 peptidoglycan DD-metalloendopeptidase family protein [Comamonadaceae bacterium]MBK9986461.1 peptidoglycan DD-metalloendopeptidase family protein [Betaproteobacteria bacterium]
MAGRMNRIGVLAVCLALAMALGACSSKPQTKAPVEDRSATATQPAGAADAKPLPGAENAGKPGYYTVKRGDTVMRIGLETGQAWRDIVRWNNLENPNLIEVGQVLRVVPPVAATAAASPATGAVSRPVASSSVAPAGATPPVGQAAPAASAAAAAPAASASTAPATATAGEDEIVFIWPGTGAVIAGFDEAKNKGLDLGGKAGDPVVAAADGRVVYAGAGLRGYGNLVILKHNNTYLTAYAHNQTLLVKEDQTVRKGQKIAEMGNSDADRVKLHFEIRRQGKPVDPAKYLPPR